MSNEPIQDIAEVSQFEASQDPETSSLQEDIRNGTWLEKSGGDFTYISTMRVSKL
ncbi:hypothetical protein OHB12_14585 [Nocardia sp. NBC_01730]|uniref:hypothetical protein n=1 Tax=Nocardia sp. NBC_01730 TaxID=2975998 RepID=UPI002E15BA01|nr:hypothetical protein OHB12_14585 [Nocardia sp. NBC_01730]